MTRYVIEHEKHGVYVGIDWSSSGDSYGPRFSWARKRSDGAVFATEREAKEALIKIKEFHDTNWKRQKWINDLRIFDLTTGKYLKGDEECCT